jgi:two-component system, OmpR family, alkaline phosphatase synthesis response regulator PhoP
MIVETAVPGPGLAERILVVEDDLSLQRALKRTFEGGGFVVDLQSDAEAALKTVCSVTHSAVVVDLTLKKESRKDLCREIRAGAPSLPLVVLSASGDVSEIVLFLELGVDDYVTIPFSPKELLARVRTALRHANRPYKVNSTSFDGIVLDFDKAEVTRDGRRINLMAGELRTLKFFLQNEGRVITRAELLAEVFGYRSEVASRTVDNRIMTLRKKLERNRSCPSHFLTVHRVGYRFVR